MIPLFSKLTNGEMTIFLSCLFGAEFAAEREACRACKGTGQAYGFAFDADRPDAEKWKCAICRGLGTVRVAVECPECKGNPKYGVEPSYLEPPHNRDKPCKTCKRTGRIPAPIIDPRWLSYDVLDLARTIKEGDKPEPRDFGIATWYEYSGEQTAKRLDPELFGPHDYPYDDGTSDCRHGCGAWMGPARSGGKCDPFGPCPNNPKKFPPRFDLMPILRDALMDEGCNNEEILRHCESMVHLPQCWVPEAILGGK